MDNSKLPINQIIEKLEAQTLESRKRLDTIQEVEQENLKFNRALRKLYNELTRERETELNKAREEAKEIVDMALSESDRILQFLLKLQQSFERGKIRVGHIGVRTNELHAMTHFLGDADFRAFLDLVDSEVCLGVTPTLNAFEQGA